MTVPSHRLASLLALALIACSSNSSTRSSAHTATGNEPDSAGSAIGDTWANYASSFVQMYCVGCHGPSDSTGRDFDVEANVRKNLEEIRCGVAVKQDPSWNCGKFPPAEQFPIGSGPKPSDDERNRFVAWITAGAR